jgi:peptide/nickel transport system permease protein
MGLAFERASLAEIVATITEKSGVQVQLDPSPEFGDYLQSSVEPLHVDLSGKTVAFALDEILQAHRLQDEMTKLFWQLRPEGVRISSKERIIEPRLFLLGTDALGRDLFSRILYGGQISLTVGLVGVFLTTILGLFFGGIAGYVGGLTDFLLMRLVDLLMAVPGFYLMLALRNSVGQNLESTQSYLIVVMILSFVSWASFCRLTRGVVLSLREQDYATAARALGASHWRCIVRHILPNAITYTIVHATIAIPYYILGEVALSFLGLGISEPHASWGNMLKAAENVSALEQHPWVLVPGIFIFVTVLAYNFLGDALRDASDPRAS